MAVPAAPAARALPEMHPAFEERDAAAKARHEQGKRLRVRRAVGQVGTSDFSLEALAHDDTPWWERAMFVVGAFVFALLLLTTVMWKVVGFSKTQFKGVFLVYWFLLGAISGVVFLYGALRLWFRVKLVQPYEACKVEFLPVPVDARLRTQLNHWADLRPDKQRSGNWVYDPTYTRVRITWKYVEGCEAEFAPKLTGPQKETLHASYEIALGRMSYSRAVEMWVDTTLYSQYLAGDVLRATWDLTSAALDVAVASTYSSNVPFILSGSPETDIVNNTKCVARLALFQRYLMRQAVEVQASLGQY
jgi:hypothetical protein